MEPTKPSAQEVYSKARFAYASAIADLERIKTDYPGTEEAEQAQQLLRSQCKIIQADIDGKREQEAQAKMRLAKSFRDRGKMDDYIKWLKDIARQYDDTPTGKGATQELKKWE